MPAYNNLKQAQFNQDGLTVVRGLISPDAIREIIHTTTDVNYFTGPHQAPNTKLFLASLKRGGPLANMAIGHALEAVGETGDELGVDLRHETVRVKGKRQERPARVQSVEIPERTITPYGVGGDHVAAVIDLAGDLTISGEQRSVNEVLQPGDVAFVQAAVHQVATSSGAQALLIAGSRQAAQIAA